ncbi:Ubiquitin carboxyl-terminal hydrolase 48 [Armadillidium vulgare]|nr:Ubiquitin carboxyl-terminal hydrolase 48 [Armadillidium vulgare]
MVSEGSSKIVYKSEKWKWVQNLEDKTNLLKNPKLILEQITKANILQTFGVKKTPKNLPCQKKCSSNPFCLTSILKETKSIAMQLTEQPRNPQQPVGLQNTANTCWINSALQALFHINKFRALACSSDSVFEKLAVFVTKEIMQKDQDFEVLKCVSEFLENTIDYLLGNPRTGAQFSPIFRTTLHRVASWTCSSCQKKHFRQLNPDTCYTMAAYVSGDECPLDQCILDLQTETQTGVSLTCEDGCGETVNVDRVVKPQILNLPSLLIIRNNSLIDREIKRRLHVVFPETLDLTPFTCSEEPAPYSLRAVIYHHGHWIKHFSAHVKTEAGKWFNFNDEKVSNLVSRSGNCPPLETHKDYFSVAQVANKYKNKSKLRVSRGAFIWIYERNGGGKNLLNPPTPLLNYVRSKQKNTNTTSAEIIEKRREEREKMLHRLAVVNPNQKWKVISRPLLSEWFSSQEVKFVPQPSLLAKGICEHRRFNPLKTNSFHCIKSEVGDELINSECGIHPSDSKIPVVYSVEEAFCKDCISKHAHHILFKDYIKDLQKQIKKESFKTPESDTTFIGINTIANWAKLALNIYLKELEFDDLERALADDENEDIAATSSESEANGSHDTSNDSSASDTHEKKDNEDKNQIGNDSVVSENGKSSSNSEDSLSYFNEDIICPHSMINPTSSGLYVANHLSEEIKKLCSGMIHPALYQNDFGPCSDCKLVLERRRPLPNKDTETPLYLLSREFLADWRSFLRACLKEESEVIRPNQIVNSSLLCEHNQLKYTTHVGGTVFTFAAVLWEEEWKIINEFYSYDHCIEGHFVLDRGFEAVIGVCDKGCVEVEATRLYEEQFDYEYELINIRQVNSESDVPSGASVPKKKPRLASLKEKTDCGLSSLRTASLRLVRASKTFSSSDTLKEIQNFIAERTGIWPFLQTLWLSGGKEYGPKPFLLEENHRSMTLKALRIKPGDTVYFRAAMEDMERAAGDGETEYNEIED